MSERKSWDVQRKPRLPRENPSAAAPAHENAPRSPSRPVRASAPKAATPVIVRRSARPNNEPSRRTGRLRERRKRKRRAFRYVLLVIFILLIAAGWYGLWLPAFRIGNVEAEGAHAAAIQQIVASYTQGTYYHLVPRNSVFFFPRQHIRNAVLDANPDVSAVSVTRTSFSSIAIRTVPRAEAFLWCGTAVDTPLPGGDCYEADIEGYVFKDAGVGNVVSASSTASTTDTSTVSSAADDEKGEVRMFGPLTHEVADGQSPIRASVVTPGTIPDMLKFIAAVRELGAPVSAYAIRGDEADLWVGDATRITYVIGHEKDAALLAESTLPSLSLTDGSIQYVDLRFPGKAYVKPY